MIHNMELPKFSGRWLALAIVAALPVFMSGCIPVSSDRATSEYSNAVKSEQSGDFKAALKSYQTAAGGTVTGRSREQVQADLARFALAQAQAEAAKADDLAARNHAKPDYSQADPYAQAAVDTFTLLVKQTPDKKINLAPTRLLKVTDWLGYSTTPLPNGPLAQAEAMASGKTIPVVPPVSPAEAVASLKAGKDAEQNKDLKTAMQAYLRAAQVDFSDQPQALADAGRTAIANGEGDIALNCLRTLVRKFPDHEVTVSAVDEKVVHDWAGTLTDHKGDFLASEILQDKINKQKLAYQVVDGLVAMSGRNKWYSAALMLLLITVVIKAAMTPLTKIQFHSTRKMTAIQPKMKALQEQYKEKPEEMNKRVMALYKEEGVNPVGCGATMLIQFPILIGLYSVIRMYNFQFRNYYFLWVNPHTAKLAPGLIGTSLAQPDMILLVLYAISMYLSQKLTIMPSQDEQQRQQQMMMAYMMPIMFLFILKTFPSAFVLYWLLFNFFTTWQQWHLLKMHPMPPPDAGPVTVSAPVPKAPRSPDAPPKAGPKQTPPKRKK
jgi:YidC/Oxa1 family membrane protein insertase